MVHARRDIAEKKPPLAMSDGLAFAWAIATCARGLHPASRASAQTTTRELAVAAEGGWLVATGDRRGRYYVLGPKLLATPADGEVVSPAT